MTKEEFCNIIVSEHSSFKFLGADEGYWLGVDEVGNERKCIISEMTKSHRENCINYLKKQEGKIKQGNFLQGIQYNKSEYDELKKFGYEAYKQKIEELSI